MARRFLAKYLRLSVEDGDMVLNDAKEESNSISHQRELVNWYISDRQLYSTMQPLEFVDDGYSGTNFERPAVREMLSLVREGKICCIIVKDLSRFGRNYLEVGDYLEQIFPFMGVRFIAINDGYDSNEYIGTTGGIEISFKNLLYDMYSKDLSEKMRSSLLIRRKRGEFIGPRAPFGYRFSDNKKILTIDEVAAQYVKYIFELACEGCRTGEIAKILNKERIPTPGQYKNREKLQYHIIDGEGYWDSGKVRKILQNKVYVGTVVNGRFRVSEVGGSHFKQVPDEEQICVPGRHEAIITEQEYIQALKVLKNKGCQKGKKHIPKQESILLGKLRCGHCKRSLIRLSCTAIPYFICKKAGYEENTKCINERLSEPELEAAVLGFFNEKLVQENRERKSRKSDINLPVHGQISSSLEIHLSHSEKELAKMCMALEQKQKSLKLEKQCLYEQYKRNQIERKIYLNRVEALREKEKTLSQKIQNLQEETERYEEDGRTQKEEDEYTGKLDCLTREVVDEWIEAIYVYGKSQFDIVYKEKIKKSKKSIKNC